MSNNLMVPPMAKMKLTTAVDSLSKGVLKSGRSMMDWIRISTKKDFSGSNGQLMKIDEEELSKHCAREDCWILLGANVYNVTAFMEFHPGGESELLRSAGTDGTQLFAEIHSWVNYKSMLDSCFVGLFTGRRSKLPRCKLTIDSNRLDGSKITLQNLGIRIACMEDDTLLLSSHCSNLRTDQVLIETADAFFRILIRPLEQETVELIFEPIPKSMIESEFAVAVESNGSIRVTFNTCKDMNLLLNPNICTVRVNTNKTETTRRFRPSKLENILSLTADIRLYVLNLPTRVYSPIPVGHHVLLRLYIDAEKTIERPYSPVLVNLDSSICEYSTMLHFIIRICERGQFTKALDQLELGARIDVSDPIGQFDGYSAQTSETVCLLAAGTGFTPMVKLIRCRVDFGRRTKLLLFNRTVNDIVWPDGLNRLVSTGMLQVVHVLSRPNANWTGIRGLISESMLLNLLPSPSDDLLVCICGPDRFTENAFRYLKNLGFNDRTVHAFQG